MQLEIEFPEKMSEHILQTRKNLRLDRAQFANLLNMSSQGESIIKGWETGEIIPTKSKLQLIKSIGSDLSEQRKNAPFLHDQHKDAKFKFIDLFAGIGGIRLPFQKLGGECVFTSEWDKFAQKTYAANFGDIPNGDITQISACDIPCHDILLAGFPCQAFSQAGLKQGFNDTRGTMFFEIQRILAEKRPKAFLLENVKQLRGHDKGRTLDSIMGILRGDHQQDVPSSIPMSEEARNALSKKLNYCVDYKVLRAGDFGAPQNRERIFIVGFDKNYYGESVDFSSLFDWPIPPHTPTRLGDILEDINKTYPMDDKYTISDKLWAGHQKRKEKHKSKGNGFGYSLFSHDSEYANTISARYYKDGSEILIDQDSLGKNPRKLTPRECGNLQGFPKNYIVTAVSHGQMYKQFGNSVCVNVIEAVAKQVILAMGKKPQER